MIHGIGYTEKRAIYNHRLFTEKCPLLGSLDIELTERCNNNCIHCYINLAAEDRTARERELSTEDIKKILEEAASLGCLMVRFTGGEPLLREDFEALYLYARRLGLKVIIFTNATRITPRLADLFTRIPPLEMMEISVYGMKKNSYEAVTRVPDSFEAAWQGINLLLDRKVPFIVKGALLPPNKNDVKEFTDWAATLPGMTYPPAFSMALDLRGRRDSENKNSFIRHLRSSPGEVLQMLTRNPEHYLRVSREFSSKFIRPPGKKLFSCGAGVGNACVDAYGNLQACMLLRHPGTIYHLKKGSLKTGMTDFFPEMRQLTAKNPDYLARCARCFLKGLCEQCPAKSWMEHGTLDTPVQYFCDLAHVKARFIGLLKKDEHAWKVNNYEERIDICRKWKGS